jgi:hypothetical protein
VGTLVGDTVGICVVKIVGNEVGAAVGNVLGAGVGGGSQMNVAFALVQVTFGTNTPLMKNGDAVKPIIVIFPPVSMMG